MGRIVDPYADGPQAAAAAMAEKHQDRCILANPQG